jgi:hypothetical protein
LSATSYVVFAAVVSVAIGAAAAQAGLRLIVLALAIGWLRWAQLMMRLHYVVLPRHVARIALDDRWKRPGWRGNEDQVLSELRIVSGGNRRVLRRARGMVQDSAADVGRRSVAIDRLDAAIRDLAAARRNGRRATVRHTVAPTSWAIGTGGSALVLLSEVTPGPVMAQPWRTLAGLAAAGATGSLVSLARYTGTSGRD